MIAEQLIQNVVYSLVNDCCDTSASTILFIDNGLDITLQCMQVHALQW